jgi:hypothetical protein
MLKSVSRAVSAAAIAAAIAAAFTVFPAASDKVAASAPLNNGKGDRLDIRTAVGPDCSQQAWPYYEANCVKDRRQAMSQAKPVRVITADRPTRSTVTR